MAVAPVFTSPAAILRYEDYVTEAPVEGRYDIVEGIRIFMPGASWRHQRVQYHVTTALGRFEETGAGMVLTAPFDILIRRTPRLQTRQPDILFITHTTLAQGGGSPETGPLTVVPELIVEIISDSETESRLAAKLADYCAIGVREAWVVRSDTRTVEVLRLTVTGPVRVALYTDTQSLNSDIFPALQIPVADLFRP